MESFVPTNQQVLVMDHYDWLQYEDFHDSGTQITKISKDFTQQ
jgi:hypothetical protein